MLELSRILVIIEPDADEQPALEKARQLAKYADSEIELIIADCSTYLEDGYYFDPIQAQKLRYEHGDQRIKELNELAKPLRSQGLEVSVSTAWGNPPYGEIVARINDTKPSLVIKSTRHHSKVSRMLLSNDDWELVRYCPAPLLLVKSQLWGSKPVFIASVDPDHVHDKPAALDNKIVSSAIALAAISAGDVHLIHSAWVPPLSGVYPLAADAEKEDEKLTKLIKTHRVLKSNCHWTNQDIVHALPDLAVELKASCVVMGAVSRSRFDRILIGNTAEKVLDRLECDVLVIKPDQMPALSKILL
ncbi:MAG TPA: universal stress protein [Gammaproteobacteria bacterium]|nr:universal stress protein [Gammaproteobacteria bacterium]